MRQKRRTGLLNVKSRTFQCQRERNDYMLYYEQVFGNVFERRESKSCALLMKNRRKVKVEQVIILQMDQQLKPKHAGGAKKNAHKIYFLIYWKGLIKNF